MAVLVSAWDKRNKRIVNVPAKWLDMDDNLTLEFPTAKVVGEVKPGRAVKTKEATKDA